MIGSRVTVHGVVRSFGGVRALDELNLTAEPGRILALVGPSGSGKTTLLRALAGFESIDAGEIRFDDETVSSPKRLLPPAGRGLGMVFQDLALWPHLSLMGHLEFSLGRTVDRVEARRRSAALIDELGLAGLEKRRPHELSGGQAQRLALARALIHQPRLLLLDEPLSSVDRETAREIRRLLAATVERRGVTMIHVTHDVEEAFEMGDAIAVLRRGRVVREGSPEEVWSDPGSAFVARFLGPCAIVKGRAENGVLRTALGDWPIPASIEASRARLLLRDSDLACGTGPGGIQAKALSCVFRGGHHGVRVRIGEIELEARSARPVPAGAEVSLTVTPHPCIVADEEGGER